MSGATRALPPEQALVVKAAARYGLREEPYPDTLISDFVSERHEANTREWWRLWHALTDRVISLVRGAS